MGRYKVNRANSADSLKRKVIKVLKLQGFKINPHVRPAGTSKKTYKRVQKVAKDEQILKYKNFLTEHFGTAKSFCRDGNEILPENIKLELREIKPDSLDGIIARWWNLIWWSLPYQTLYGRQLRFLLWDVTHDAPFGIIYLQSPILRMSVRDKALGIPNDKLDYWVNMSLSAQRVGALPPYNEILGGKMVALALTSNEVRDIYKKKFNNTLTLMKERNIPPMLLFITTTSAFGRSSIYNRLKYHSEIVAEQLGFTQGSGSFHIPENLYEELIQFLRLNDVNVQRGYGNGPSRKLRLMALAFRYLGLPSFEYHGIKREVFLFSLVKNLKKVIQKDKKPLWINRPFDELVDYWKERWALPRAERIPEWKNFSSAKFFRTVNKMLSNLENR
jgi:hypothetical protein